MRALLPIDLEFNSLTTVKFGLIADNSWQSSCILQQNINYDPTTKNGWPFSYNIEQNENIDMCGAEAIFYLPESFGYNCETGSQYTRNGECYSV